jgi:hypothetical protein
MSRLASRMLCFLWDVCVCNGLLRTPHQRQPRAGRKAAAARAIRCAAQRAAGNAKRVCRMDAQSSCVHGLLVVCLP